jgi:hypothetical protein
VSKRRPKQLNHLTFLQRYYLEVIVLLVKIELAEKESTHANELKDALVSFFLEVDYATEDWLSKASLRELVLRGLSDFETK